MIGSILTIMIALEHTYILYMEMFAWETRGKSFFKSLPDALFKDTKTIAANQGLYNWFLVAGLIWSFLIENSVRSLNIRLFFLGCICLAGIYGASTAEKKIFFAQALPAILAIAFSLLKL